jgi:hypothetical protein
MLTTRSNVPGKPIFLYNDPTVPLYNYGNQMFNRTYATEIIQETALWYSFTKQYTEFFKATENYIDEDANESTQTRTFDVGVIEITELTTDQTKIFELNVPIAFWIMGVQHDITIDTSEYNYNASFNSSLNKKITASISSATLSVYYNDTLVELDGTQVVSVSDIIDFEFNSTDLEKDYYALQYIGNVSVSNLKLPTIPGYIYTIKLNVVYGYSNDDVSSYIRLFSSGIIPHVDSKNSLDTHNCIILSSTPDYVNSSFVYYPVGTKEIYYPV